MKKFLKFIPVSLLVPFLLSAANEKFRVLHDPRAGKTMPYSPMPGDRRNVIIPQDYTKKPNEFRGVWVVTVANLDFPRTDSPYAFKQQYLDFIQNIKKSGFNAVIFQIRPTCDAFYNSRINPFSRAIRGEEGKGYPQMDMLGFMIDEAHKAGLEFHAWLNPYRVTGITNLPRTSYLKTLSPLNFARKNPDAVLAAPFRNGQTLLLDPGNPIVRKHLVDTVAEIVAGYNPDAIHFDDYFYPYEGIGNADSMSYRRYNPSRLPLDDWRRNNVNLLVKEVSETIRRNNASQGKKIRFGISPFGIWLNKDSSPYGSPTRGNESYKTSYADTRLWIMKNWIDYIAPQIYWPFSQPKAPYAALVDWWADTVSNSNVKLYIGIGAHIPISPDNQDEFKNQILYNCRRPEVAGAAFYSYNKVFRPENNTRRNAVNKVIGDCWKKNLPSSSGNSR